MQEHHNVSPKIKELVWSGNFGIAFICFSWLPSWIAGHSWDTVMMFVGLGFAWFISTLEKEARAEIVAQPSAFRRYALPVSAGFFCAITGIQLSIALTQHRASVWGMAAISILIAALSPLSAWIDPILLRKKVPNQPSVPTRPCGPSGSS
jgi:hypothetical protein